MYVQIDSLLASGRTVSCERKWKRVNNQVSDMQWIRSRPVLYRVNSFIPSAVRPLYALDRYYKPSVLLMCFFVPTSVPWYLWGESLWVAYFIPALLRYTLVLNASWLVNSAAHMWGNRPYDKNINPRENKFVTFSAIGMDNVHMFLFQQKKKWRQIKNRNGRQTVVARINNVTLTFCMIAQKFTFCLHLAAQRVQVQVQVQCMSKKLRLNESGSR